MNAVLNRDGYEVVNNQIKLDDTELGEITRYLEKTDDSNFGNGTILKIINWEDSEISNRILFPANPSVIVRIIISSSQLYNKYFKSFPFTINFLLLFSSTLEISRIVSITEIPAISNASFKLSAVTSIIASVA